MKVICGDAVEVIKTLPDNSVDCCVTSPPYYNLRDYETDGQIGLEDTPEKYIERLSSVFIEVYRILKPDGTLWINISDSYGGSSKGKGAVPCGKQKTNVGSTKNGRLQVNYTDEFIKPKDMMGIPWMLAFALRNAGWYLRSDIIWHKTNAMPNRVKDRPISCYEHVFLLTKSRYYYFDQTAIEEDSVSQNGKRRGRDVWSFAKNNSHNKHYAAFPIELARKCILAGSPKGGVILDPFCGSGTSGEAALISGRDCILVDINPEYCEMAKQRLANIKVGDDQCERR